MNKTQREIVTICLIITAGFFVSEMHSTVTYHAGLRSPQSVPTETAVVRPAASLAQFSNDKIQLPEPPVKVWYKSESAVGPTETGLEWMSPKTPALHLLDLRNRQ